MAILDRARRDVVGTRRGLGGFNAIDSVVGGVRRSPPSAHL